MKSVTGEAPAHSASPTIPSMTGALPTRTAAMSNDAGGGGPTVCAPAVPFRNKVMQMIWFHVATRELIVLRRYGFRLSDCLDVEQQGRGGIAPGRTATCGRPRLSRYARGERSDWDPAPETRRCSRRRR